MTFNPGPDESTSHCAGLCIGCPAWVFGAPETQSRRRHNGQAKHLAEQSSELGTLNIHVASSSPAPGATSPPCVPHYPSACGWSPSRGARLGGGAAHVMSSVRAIVYGDTTTLLPGDRLYPCLHIEESANIFLRAFLHISGSHCTRRLSRISFQACYRI